MKRNIPPQTKSLPLGYCIYCGASDDERLLTDEHIIPLSLGGKRVLPSASCLPCADATKLIEQHAAQVVFRDVRIEFGLPTRRPKSRPSHLPMVDQLPGDVIDETWKPNITLVPTEDYPGTVCLLHHEPPGILLGHPPDAPTQGFPWFRTIYSDDRQERLERRAIPLKTFVEFKPDIIARLYAKVGLAIAADIVGYGAFKPLIQHLITDPASNPYHWVGETTADLDVFPPLGDTDPNHRTQLAAFQVGDRWLIRVQVQMFVFLEAPIFTVVVGELTPAGLSMFEHGQLSRLDRQASP